MQRTIRQLIQSLMITVLAVIALVCSAYAANIDATVPASLPITVSSDGVVTTATNAAIHNYGSSPIRVSSINVTAENGWSLATKDAAASASIGAKVISMGFNGSWMDASGAVDTFGFDRISSSGTLNLSYDAKTPGVVTAESSSTAATATFVVGFVPEPPTMAEGSLWYKSTKNRNTITKITFMDSYTPSAISDETWNADVNDAGDIKCYRTGTEIIIAGNGAGKIKANADSSYMFSDSSYANYFEKLASIENLTLLDTSNVTDMSIMFYYCSGLTSLDLSNFNTTKVTYMDSMFNGCYGLTRLDLSNFDTANVTSMCAMFSGCRRLTSLDVSHFDTAKVTNMSIMFSGCSDLTRLDVSNFDTAKVSYMYSMFSGCSGLTSLDVSNFDTAKVTQMYSMFSYCSGLMTLDLSNFDTAKVTYMYSMFSYCSGLTSLDLSSFDTTKVTDMHSLFNSCNKLKTIYAGDHWNTDKVIKSDEMFYSCMILQGDIAFNSAYTDKTYAKITDGYLTDINRITMAAGSIWYKSTQNRNTITKITFMDSYTPTGSEDETWNADKDNSGSIKCYRTGTEIIIAGNGAGKIKANANSKYLFSYSSSNSRFKKLASIENLALLDTSNVTDMSYMFYTCNGLKSLDVSNFDTSNVTSMGFMFTFCRGLTSLDVSHFDTTKVTNMNAMFLRCSGLTNLDVSHFDTTKVTNMNAMFSYCSGLTSLDVSNFDTANVTDMDFMFDSCSGLTSLDVSNFDTANVTRMNSMFKGCSALITIYAGDAWNTDKVTSNNNMFGNCAKLKGVISYDSSKTDVTYANWTTGYFTYKAASTKTLSLNIDPTSGAVTSYDVSTASISRFRAFLDWSDTANVA